MYKRQCSASSCDVRQGMPILGRLGPVVAMESSIVTSGGKGGNRTAPEVPEVRAARIPGNSPLCGCNKLLLRALRRGRGVEYGVISAIQCMPRLAVEIEYHHFIYPSF